MTAEPLLPDVSAWAHADLHRRVIEAVAALPVYFRTETFISGIPAPDLHTLHGVLGASIEDQLVATLNTMRGTWDPTGAYAVYSFVRQPQTFPDVLLQRPPVEGDPSVPLTIMGIELKGWYLLATEGEPNFRYVATPAASNEHDLLVVVPWALAQVISGHPLVFTPFIVGARLAAERRNKYWRERKTKGSTVIKVPAGTVVPYQRSRGSINDEAEGDGGGNFGRIARSRIIDEYVGRMQDRLLCGVRLRHWLGFFLALQGKGKTDAEITKALDALAEEMAEDGKVGAETAEAVSVIIGGLRSLVFPEGAPEEDEEE